MAGLVYGKLGTRVIPPKIRPNILTTEHGRCETMSQADNPYTAGAAAHKEVCAYCTAGIKCAQADRFAEQEADYAASIAAEAGEIDAEWIKAPRAALGSPAARQRANMAAGLVPALVPADVLVHMAANGVELLIGRPSSGAHVVHGYDFTLAFEDAGHTGILCYLEGEAAGERAWVGAIDAMDALTIIRKHYQD
jgi:hypothetical protein